MIELEGHTAVVLAALLFTGAALHPALLVIAIIWVAIGLIYVVTDKNKALGTPFEQMLDDAIQLFTWPIWQLWMWTVHRK